MNKAIEVIEKEIGMKNIQVGMLEDRLERLQDMEVFEFADQAERNLLCLKSEIVGLKTALLLIREAETE